MRKEKQLDGSYFIYVWDKVEAHINAATPEQVNLVEECIYNNCSPKISVIAGMSETELKDFLNEKAMFYDLERGILPGLVPHRIYEHSEWFKTFEAKLWEEIEERMETCSNEFLS